MVDSLLHQLQRLPRGAALAAELPASSDTLTGLERTGAVVVREHTWPDPCLEGADLRVVALVQNGDVSSALDNAEAVWQRWLAEYLNQHRCC